MTKATAAGDRCASPTQHSQLRRPNVGLAHRFAFNTRRQIGQAAFETALIVAMIALMLVVLPDSAIERLLIAIEGRHQAILRHATTP
jgi:hypothetical protein